MNIFYSQIIETLIVILVYGFILFATNSYINNALKSTHVERGRRKLIIKAVYLISTIAALVFMGAIWGLEQNEIAVFLSTILTAFGIAFFAQWSLLSNITSSILIFFNHPVKLGDYVKVLHKDYHFEGEVMELNYFFVHLKTKENAIITIPNSHFFDKSFSVIENKINSNQQTK
jgi:small-conductance mechanosensitive channel